MDGKGQKEKTCISRPFVDIGKFGGCSSFFFLGIFFLVEVMLEVYAMA